MPYYYKTIGDKKCVYKKEDNTKVGCTKKSIKKYLAALHANVDESNEIKGGKADKLTISDIAKKFNLTIDDIKKQLEKGVKIEKEHTPNEVKATEIAMDHLSEIPDYYNRLDKMEKSAKEKWGINENTKSIIKRLLREGLFDGISDQDFINAYVNKINKTSDNLLIKGQKNPNYVFLLSKDVKYQPCGDPNKCETNAWAFVKERINEGLDYFFPVGGFGFEGPNLWPVEHWWVYDSKEKIHIEITPLHGNEKFRCYAGIINLDINDEIAKSNKFYDVDFFKGGNVFLKYFKF
jgi:hypothetical protein